LSGINVIDDPCAYGLRKPAENRVSAYRLSGEPRFPVPGTEKFRSKRPDRIGLKYRRDKKTGRRAATAKHVFGYHPGQLGRKYRWNIRGLDIPPGEDSVSGPLARREAVSGRKQLISKKRLTRWRKERGYDMA